MSDEKDEKGEGSVPDPCESSSQDSPEEFSTQPATQPMEGNEDSQDETMDESQTEYEEKQVIRAAFSNSNVSTWQERVYTGGVLKA